MSTVAMIRAFVFCAVGALVERALCVPQGAVITPAPTPIPIVFGSAQALPDLNAAATASGDDCDACYIIADVAAVVWYSEVFLNPVATEVVSVGVGNNSRATRTSTIVNEAPFTFDPDRMSSAFSSDVALTPVSYASTVNLGGAILTSPTAYNVFSAYSITSAYRVNGECRITSGSPVVLPTPYSETLASASGRVTLDPAGEQAFIDSLGFTTCSPAGERAVANTALVPVANITKTTTTTGSSVSLAGQLLQSLAPTTNPTSTNAFAALVTLTQVMESTTVTAVLTGTAFPAGSASAPVIVAGSTTVTASGGAISLAAFEPSVISALFGNATTVPPSGTVTGTGVGNYSVVPFLSGAGTVGSSLTAVWGTALAAVVFFVSLL